MRSADNILVWLALFLAGAAANTCAQTDRGDAPADPNFIVQSWGTSEGLPTTVILHIEQTPDGYLWLGSTHGLTRFDGVRFETFLSTRAEHRLGTRIEEMDVDSTGRLWIVAEQRGLLTYHNRRITELHTNNAALKYPTVDVCSDPTGWIWALDARGNLARLPAQDTSRIELVDFKLPSDARLLRDAKGALWAASPRNVSGIIAGEWATVLRSRAEIQAAAAARDGGLWLALEGQLQHVNSEGRLTAHGTFPWTTGTTRVNCLFEDAQGIIWIGTSSRGLFQRTAGRFNHVMTTPRAINCLTRDREGNLWAGTRGGGLVRIGKRNFRMFDSRAGLHNEYINSVAEDGTGRVWLATEESGLGWVTDGSWQSLGPEQGWPGYQVFCMTPARPHGLWLGTGGRGLWRWQSNQFTQLKPDPGLPMAAPRCLHEARDGSLWVVLGDVALFSVKDGKVLRHGPRNGLNTRRVRALTEDPAGGIWAGDWHGGIWRWEGTQWEEKRAPTSITEAVRALAMDPRGNLWIGTAGAGLLRWQAGRVANIGAEQGLPGEDIQQMILDEDTLWFGIGKGLYHVSLEQLDAVAEGHRAQIAAVRHGQSEGLPELHFTGRHQPRTTRTAKGELWFATANGAVRFQPAALATNEAPLQAVIETVLINDQPRFPTTALYLRSNARRLEFRFTAPSFSAPERVRFRYQLEGVDDDWIECGSNRFATYASIPFGTHGFRVAAGNAAGVWGLESERVLLVMQPYFWQTQWFIALIAAAAAGGLAWGARRATLRRLNRKLKLLEQEHAVERERARISRDIHDELGANLTTIGLLADMGIRHRTDPEVVRRDLARISETARGSASAMDAIVWAVNPRNDSLDHFANYIGQFTKDFFRPTPIRTRLELPQDLPAQPMPAEMRHNLFLAVKEALNNVARHAEATEVRLRLQVTTTRLFLSIEDNGRGIADAVTTEGHDGLANMRARVEKVGGDLAIETTPGGGTRLAFSVPLTNSKPH